MAPDTFICTVCDSCHVDPIPASVKDGGHAGELSKCSSVAELYPPCSECIDKGTDLELPNARGPNGGRQAATAEAWAMPSTDGGRDVRRRLGAHALLQAWRWDKQKL